MELQRRPCVFHTVHFQVTSALAANGVAVPCASLCARKDGVSAHTHTHTHTPNERVAAAILQGQHCTLPQTSRMALWPQPHKDGSASCPLFVDGVAPCRTRDGAASHITPCTPRTALHHTSHPKDGAASHITPQGRRCITSHPTPQGRHCITHHTPHPKDGAASHITPHTPRTALHHTSHITLQGRRCSPQPASNSLYNTQVSTYKGDRTP